MQRSRIYCRPSASPPRDSHFMGGGRRSVAVLTGERRNGCTRRGHLCDSSVAPIDALTPPPPAPLATLDDVVAKALHLFQLRAELQEKKIDSRFFKPADLLLYLPGRSYQPRAQSPI
jgi:hypothetical protein